MPTRETELFKARVKKTEMEETEKKERNTRYSNNENDNYTGHDINNRSIIINNRSYIF